MTELLDLDLSTLREVVMSYPAGEMTDAQQRDALETIFVLCDLADFMAAKIRELVDLSDDAFTAIREATP
jgi:hypothetical protein